MRWPTTKQFVAGFTCILLLQASILVREVWKTVVQSKQDIHWMAVDQHTTQLKLQMFVGSEQTPVEKALANFSAMNKALAQIGADYRNNFASQENVIDGVIESLAQFNGRILPSFNTLLGTGNGLLSGAGVRGAALADRADGLIDSAKATTDGVSENVQAAKPVMADLAKTVHETAGTAEDTHKIASYELHQITKPVTKVAFFAKSIIRGAGWFFGF